MRVTLDLNDEQVRSLRTALSRAKAAELSEAVRLNRLGTTGYAERGGGSDAQNAEVRKARNNIDVLNIVLDNLPRV